MTPDGDGDGRRLDVASALEALGELTGGLRADIGASAVVVARVPGAVSAQGAGPSDLTVVTARFAPEAPTRSSLDPGTLLPITPFLQHVIARREPVARLPEDDPDVVVEAYFPDAHAIAGVHLADSRGSTVGVLLMAGEEIGDVELGVTASAAHAIADVLSTALDLLERDGDHHVGAAEVSRLQRRLEVSEERYRRFIASTSEAIWCLEPPSPQADGDGPAAWTRLLADARFVEANHTFARRFGFASPRELLGRKAGELQGFWLLADGARLERIAAAGFTSTAQRVTEHDPAGQSRVLSTSHFGTIDARGLRSLWAIERDVTAQVDEDRALRESAEFYRAISRTALDGICVLDANLEVLDCNDAFLELLARSEAPHLEAGDVPIVPYSDGVSTAEWFDRMGDSGTWRGEARVRRADESFVPVELACRVTVVGGPRRYYCFVRDLSERIQAEQRESEHHQELAHAARLSTLGEMTSGLAHELNQPLAAIVNYANGCLRLLQQNDLDLPMVPDALRSIVEQSGRAAEIIRRMRSFARRDSEKREPNSIASVLGDALELASQDLTRANVAVTTEYAADPDEVVVDGIQIEQVALNLIRNAVEAFARSPTLDDRRLRVSTSIPGDTEAAGPFVLVTVEDNGPGISDSTSGQVFDPFFTSGTPGIGLGLTVSRSIVEAHGGRLWLDPAPAGARFCFTIPLRNAPIPS